MTPDNSPQRQALTVIIGMVSMSAGMAIVVFHGAPEASLTTEGHFHAFFDLASYLCPLLAAVCAGAGLFVHFPHLAPVPAAAASVAVDDMVASDTFGGTGSPSGGEEVPALSSATTARPAPGESDLKAYYLASLVLLLLGLLSYSFCHPCQSPNVTVISCAYMVTGTLVLRARVFAMPFDTSGRWLDVRVMKAMSWVTVIGCIVAFVYIHTMFINGRCMD